ncbi:MAG: DUF5011 domain-containing protein [Bacilli bacterium]|nr:DUF5011 domain-containing protein [Bacilli bacterium]
MEDEIYVGMESRMSTKTKVIIFTIFFMIIISAIIVFFKSNNFDIKKTVIYEVGDKISLDVTDYIKNKPYNANDYKLVLDSVRYDSNNTLDTVGEYTYRVVLKDIIKEGKIIVKDTKGPIVQTMDVTIGVNEKYKVEDFVVKCNDYSLPCEYEMTGNADTSKAGIYELKINSKDTYGNKSTNTVNLIVKEGYSLQDAKLKDLTPMYLEPNYEDWNNQYVIKYAGGLDPEDEDSPRWNYYYEFLDSNYADFLDDKHKGMKIESSEIIAVYNQYHYIIGFACRVKLSDGSITYLTNGE